MSPASRSEPDRWLGVEVRHLAALRAVAEEGSFGAAALRLGYAQSAISQQIAALERSVGRHLFDRPGGSRPVTLTRAGELLLGHAETIMSRLAAARSDLESLDDENVDAPIRIGAVPAVAAAILPLILAELGTDAEEVGITLTEDTDDRLLLERVERGDLDVAFAELPLPDGSLEAEALLDDPYVLVVRDDHEFADLDRAVTLEELAGMPLLGFKAHAERLDAAFGLHGLKPRFTQRLDDGATLHAFVVNGLGSGLVPRLAVDVAGKPLVVVPIESKLPPRTIAIAWHTDRLRTCTAGMLVDLAVEVAGQLDAPRA